MFGEETSARVEPFAAVGLDIASWWVSVHAPSVSSAARMELYAGRLHGDVDNASPWVLGSSDRRGSSTSDPETLGGSALP